MWAGRFAKALDSKADDFNSSIRFDCKMYRQDITGSIAHANMLAKQGIISEDDKTVIVNGLVDILADIDSGALVPRARNTRTTTTSRTIRAAFLSNTN